MANMSVKKSIYTNQMTRKKAEVWYDPEYGEYIVKFHRNGKYQPGADYYAADRRDADNTAVYWVNKEEN